MSTRAVYHPGSATRKGIRCGCIPTERYINRDRRSESIPGAAVSQQRSANQTPRGTAASTKLCIAKLDPLYVNHEPQKRRPFWTAVSIRAIHQLRSAKQKPISRSCLSTAITKPKRKHFWTTQSGRLEPYIHRDQQSESPHVTAVYQQHDILTAISKSKSYLAHLCISSVQRSNPLRQL